MLQQLQESWCSRGCRVYKMWREHKMLLRLNCLLRWFYSMLRLFSMCCMRKGWFLLQGWVIEKQSAERILMPEDIVPNGTVSFFMPVTYVILSNDFGKLPSYVTSAIVKRLAAEWTPAPDTVKYVLRCTRSVRFYSGMEQKCAYFVICKAEIQKEVAAGVSNGKFHSWIGIRTLPSILCNGMINSFIFASPYWYIQW